MSGVLTQFSSENHNDGMQNQKGRTITFRVDDEVAEKREKYAKMRNTSMSRVLRNWCASGDLRVELPVSLIKT